MPIATTKAFLCHLALKGIWVFTGYAGHAYAGHAGLTGLTGLTGLAGLTGLSGLTGLTRLAGRRFFCIESYFYLCSSSIFLHFVVFSIKGEIRPRVHIPPPVWHAARSVGIRDCGLCNARLPCAWGAGVRLHHTHSAIAPSKHFHDFVTKHSSSEISWRCSLKCSFL